MVHGRKYTLSRILFFFTRPFLWKLIFIVLFSLLSSCSVLLGSKAAGAITDRAGLFKALTFKNIFNFQYPFIWALILCFSALFSSLFTTIASVFKSHVVPYLQYNVRMYLIDIIQKFEMSYFQQNGSGFIENYISNVAEAIADIVDVFFAHIVPNICFIVFAIIYIACFQKWLGIINLVWMICHWVVYIYLSKKSVHLSKVKSEYGNTRTERTVESLQNILVIKVFNLFNYSKNRVSKEHSCESDFHKQYMIVNNFNILITNIVLLIFEIVFVLLALPKCNLTSGTIIIILSINMLLNHSVTYITESFVSIIERLGDLGKSIELLNMATTEKNNSDGLTPSLDGDIDISRFCFSTPDRRVTITAEGCRSIKRGEIVALVGKSGTGKSTLFKSMLHLGLLEENQIFISDVDIKKIRTDFLRGQIAYVSQSTGFFNTTIKDNISFGEGTEDEIMRAADIAQVGDVIRSLMETGKGMNTVVGTNNSFFSGGQIQRFCIARVIFRSMQPNSWKILIGDEITSALDPTTSKEILKAIISFCKQKNKTFIFATHAEYAVHEADSVMLLDEGRLILDTKTNLAKNSTLFREMFPSIIY